MLNIIFFNLPFYVFFWQSLGNSQREYEKHVLLYSIRNQLRFRNNLGECFFFFFPVFQPPASLFGNRFSLFAPLVRHVRKDERKYYEELLKYSREHLMLYPYHLSDIVVKGLRVTPFSYYVGIMEVSLHFSQREIHFRS